MDDTESVCSDDIKELLVSLDEEFNCVIQDVSRIHEQHEYVIDRLQWIMDQSTVLPPGIYVNDSQDFMEIIQQLHEEAVNDIQQEGHNTFCDRLLSFIEDTTFVQV